MGKNVTVWSPVLGEIVLTSALLNEILGGEAGSIVETAITTTVGGTLTAAGMVGGQIARTGPTAAFSDATDTAANIVTALQPTGFISGETFTFNLKNGTSYNETITAGTNVTLPASVVVPPFSVASYFGTIGGTSATPTVTLVHISTTPIRAAASLTTPQATALVTVGAATIPAAAFNTGFLTRGGTQTAAWTDTTDTGPNIIAAVSALSAIGTSVEMTYVNNTVFPVTIAANATGVTLSGITVIPANSWATYLVTYSAAGAITMVGVSQGYFPTSGTVTANAATPVPVSNTAVTANSQILLTYKSGTQGATGAFVSSVTAGTGFSIKSVTSDTAVYNYTILG